MVLGSNAVIGAGGAGTLFLSGSNSYTGTTMIDGNGVVQLGSTAALPPTTDVIFGVTDASTATLDLNGFNQTINSLSARRSGTSTITNSNLATPATLTISWRHYAQVRLQRFHHRQPGAVLRPGPER